MPCACCSFGDAAEQQFTSKKVAKELRGYRRKGAGPTTRLLRDGLATAGLATGTLLDVGGGLGALTFDRLDLGMSRAVVVEASSAYLAAASEETDRQMEQIVVRAGFELVSRRNTIAWSADVFGKRS